MPWRESPADLDRARAEQPAVVPSRLGGLFAIHTPAAPDAPPADLCAILLTRPRSHRNRMLVEAARRLAAGGIACVRFDYHGCGDSEGEATFLDPGRPYREDVVAVLRWARERHGHRRFAVYGACFDGRTALSAFADEAATLVGLAFFAAPVMELDDMVRAGADRKDWKHLFTALGNADNWRTLGRAERWRHMASVFSRVARRSVPGGAGGGLPLSPGFVEHFRALARSRARALFVYGELDAETPTFEAAERALLARLDPATRARFEIEKWPGHVHGYLTMERQREALERLIVFMESLRAGAGPAGAEAKEATWTSA